MDPNLVVDPQLLERIRTATGRVYRLVKPMPLVRCASLSQRYEADIWLKLEHLQPYVRAYKGRGVANFYYSWQVAPTELVTASGGNHARAVARLAAVERVPAVILVSHGVSVRTVQHIRRLGGRYVRVEWVGETFDEAYAAAWAYAEATGAIMVPPFDDIDIIAGQGTVGLEVVAQLARLDIVPDLALCQVGGGGLLSGYGTAMKAAYPKLHLVGVELDEVAAMTQSLRAGERQTVSVPVQPFAGTMAVGQPGKLTFRYAQVLVDQMVVTSQPATCRALIELATCYPGTPAEPAGATGVAALEQLAYQVKGRTVICLITGGNFDRAQWPAIRLEATLAGPSREKSA